MPFVRLLAALLFVIAVPVALITTNVRIVMNEPRTYEYATDHYNTSETTEISRSELLRASGELRAYFNNAEDSVLIRVVRNGETVSLFNERETEHLRDVQGLFRTTFRAQEAAVVFILAYVVMVFLWARERSLRRLAREVLVSGVASLASLLFAAVILLTGFDAAFERFHLIAFDNDLWQLDPRSDHLIQMFPEEFWYDVTLWVAIATAVELIVLSIGAGALLGLTRGERLRTVRITGELPAEGKGAEA